MYIVIFQTISFFKYQEVLEVLKFQTVIFRGKIFTLEGK